MPCHSWSPADVELKMWLPVWSNVYDLHNPRCAPREHPASICMVISNKDAKQYCGIDEKFSTESEWFILDYIPQELVHEIHR
jgi:hypothetical protein